MAQPVFVGINGNVIRLDGSTGDGQWMAELKGSGFVNILLDGDRVIATTGGEVFCLTPRAENVYGTTNCPAKVLGWLRLQLRPQR